MPLWKKTTTVCITLLISVPFASELLAQRLSPLTPLPMPSTSATAGKKESMFFDVPLTAPKTPASPEWASYNPIKPMAVPGGPIVKLAKRPNFEVSPPAKPASVRHIPAHKVNQAELDRLLAVSSAALANPVRIAKAQPVARVHLPAASPVRKPTTILTPLPNSALVETSKTAVALANDFPLAATTPSVVVRSPFVQPGNPNRYLFVVENIGTVDAATARVDLRVPAGVILKQVVADSASSTARHAIVHIDDLKAGEKDILEVEIQPTTVDVNFETSLTLETKRSFHGVTLPKKSVARGVPAAMPTASPVASEVTTQASFQNTEMIDTSPVSAGNGNVSATVEGPVLLAAGETGDFAIVVNNPNYGEASNVVVQLAIPQGLKITTLDREAWINDEDNTISWELASLGARQEVAIQYKAVGKTYGQQVQKVTLGMADVYQGDAKLVTLVSQ